MRLQAAIIGDDLTGTLDAAAPFADRGLKTAIALSPDDIDMAMAEGCEVLAVNTASRALPPETAAALVRQAAEVLSRYQPQVAFKKIDSRLKGNCEAETRAALDGFGLARGIVSPAIPDLGRIVVGGLLQGFGVDRPISVAIRFGDVADRLTIPDAVADEDLDAIAGDLLATGALAIGARGLAEALAKRLAVQGSLARTPFPLPRPILFGIGSRDPITAEQINELRPVLPTGAERSAPNGDLADLPESDAAIRVVVATKGEIRDSAEAVATRFAAGLADEITRRPVGSLVLCGGDTAHAVLRELGVRLLALGGEAMPGIPWATLEISGRPVMLLTKSGGFGAPETLSRLIGAGRDPHPLAADSDLPHASTPQSRRFLGTGIV